MPSRTPPLYPSEVRRREARKKASSRPWKTRYGREMARAIKHGVAAAGKRGVQNDPLTPAPVTARDGHRDLLDRLWARSSRNATWVTPAWSPLGFTSQVKDLIAITRLMEESVLPAIAQLSPNIANGYVSGHKACLLFLSSVECDANVMAS